MAHVTVFRFKAQPGKRQVVIDTFNRWEQERKPKAKGFERSAIVSNLNDPDEFIALARFDTSENYRANSENPETDTWYRELRTNLASEPEWFDGRLEAESTA
jgi:heme-degrading monooxygenase HmoA